MTWKYGMNSIILPWLYLLIIDEEIRVNTYCFCWELLIRSMSDVSRGRLNIVSIRKSYCLFTEIVYGSPSHSFLGHNERLTGESCTYKNVSASIRMPIGLVYINFCRKKLGGGMPLYNLLPSPGSDAFIIRCHA